MNTVISLLILISNVVIISLLLLFALFLRSIYKNFIEFISPAGEGKPSPLGVLVTSTSGILAQAVVMQVKTTFMGYQSGQARAVKTLEGAIAEDTLSQSDLGAAILDSFPSVAKVLRKNPSLAPLAQWLLSHVPSPAKVEVGGNGKSSASFKLG